VSPPSPSARSRIATAVSERAAPRPLAALAILLAACALLLPGLGAPDLWAPDEPRYAQVAEELRAGAGGRVLLHLGGEPYAQKPPLYFWLAALAGAPEGRVGERAARLPSALAGVATALLTLALGTALLGRRSGALGAALLLALPTFVRLARRAQLDVLLAACEGLALLAWAACAREPRLRARQLAPVHAALALAVLAKGPVGALVPLLAFAAHRSWERSRGALAPADGAAPPGLARGFLRALREVAAPRWLALSLGPALAWLAASAALADGAFLGEAVGENLLGRFFLGTSHARPLHYYLRQLPLDFLPWTLLWPLAWAVARQRSAGPRGLAWRLLACWIGAALLFFSVSAGKRGLYLIPIFPALALLCADALVAALPRRGRTPRWLGALALALVAALLAAGALLAPLLARHGLAAPPGASAAPLAAAAVGAAAWCALRGRPLARVWALAGLVALSEAIAAHGVLPALDPEKSPRPVALAAAAAAGPGAAVATSRPSLLGALLYYGGGPVRRVATPDEVAAFAAGGGRVLVVPAQDLHLATACGPVRVHARLREGRRALLVVSPLAPSPPCATRDVRAGTY